MVEKKQQMEDGSGKWSVPVLADDYRDLAIRLAFISLLLSLLLPRDLQV